MKFDETGTDSNYIEFPQQFIQCKSVEIISDTDDNTGNTNDRTIKIIASDETPVKRFDWHDWERYQLIVSHERNALDATRIENGVCLFFENHPGLFNNSRRIGKIKGYQLKNKQLILTIRMNRSEEATAYLRDVEDGTEPGNSIGFNVTKMEVVKEAKYKLEGDKKVLVTPKILKAVKWELHEVSAVDVPAIPTAGRAESEEWQKYQQYFSNFPINTVELVGGNMTKSTDPTVQVEGTQSQSDLSTYQEKINTLTQENQQLKLENQQLTNEVKVQTLRSNYLKVRNSGEKLLGKNLITKAQFDLYFNADSEVDITKLQAMPVEDSTIELKVIERSLQSIAKQPIDRLTEQKDKDLLNNTNITPTQADGVVGNRTSSEVFQNKSGQELAESLVSDIK